MGSVFNPAEKVAFVYTDDREILEQSGMEEKYWEGGHYCVFHIPSLFDDLRDEERQACKKFYDTLNEAYKRANPPGTPASEETLLVCISLSPHIVEWAKNRDNA